MHALKTTTLDNSHYAYNDEETSALGEFILPVDTQVITAITPA